MALASFEPGTSQPRVLRSAATLALHYRGENYNYNYNSLPVVCVVYVDALQAVVAVDDGDAEL